MNPDTTKRDEQRLEPLDEYAIKDFLLDYECKLNGSILCTDEWIDYIRELSKAIAEKFGKPALRLPEKKEGVGYVGYLMWNACLDKVKELNS